MLFDTDIFIYADRGVQSAKELILSHSDRAISAVTYMEYVPFCRDKRELSIFEQMLKGLSFQVYDIDTEISVSARSMVKRFALSHGVEMADALIAATALKYSEVLCTSNVKHFKPMKGFEINKYIPQD